MRFAGNNLYIEEYIKCKNCGKLIYESDRKNALIQDKKIYCSQWCADWEKNRAAKANK